MRQSMTLAVAAEAQPRPARFRGPPRRLVAACRATQEHPATLHLQQRIVALQTTDRALDRSRRAGEQTPYRSARLGGGDDRRPNLLDIRRHRLSRSLTQHY